MSYNAKNYMEQGGDKWVVGGALEIKEDASVTGLPSITVATENAIGGVKAATKSETDNVPAKIGEDGKLYVPTYPTIPEIPVAANQAESVETTNPTVAEFNALLAKLKDAGLMAADA